MLGQHYLRYRWAIFVGINHFIGLKSGWLKRPRVTDENRVKNAFASPTQSALINWSSFVSTWGFFPFAFPACRWPCFDCYHLFGWLSEVDRFFFHTLSMYVCPYIWVFIRFRANPNFSGSAKRVSGPTDLRLKWPWTCRYGLYCKLSI